MRILIAEDHGVVRQGLKILIDRQADMEVIGEAEDGLEVVELANKLLPDVILMDVTMPNMNGTEATRRILKHNSNIRILALSAHLNQHSVIEMLRAGALGYVLKLYLCDEVVKALNAVNAGEHYLSPKVNKAVMDDYLHHLATTSVSDEKLLTERERHVIKLLSEGKTTKQIAVSLHVSSKTIDANRREAMNKLDISSIAELTKFAIKEGLTSVEF